MSRRYEQSPINADRQQQRKSLLLGIFVACFIHAGAILFLGWAHVTEPDFPYVPLASLDFSPYDPTGGSPNSGLPDGTLSNGSASDTRPSPGSTQDTLGDSSPKETPSPQANKALAQQSPMSEKQPATKSGLHVIESSAETAEEIIPLPPKETHPKKKKTEKTAPKAPAATPPKAPQKRPTPNKDIPDKATPAKALPERATLAKSTSGKDNATTLGNTPPGHVDAGPGTGYNSFGHKGDGHEVSGKGGSGKGGSGQGMGRGNPNAEKAYLAHIVKKLNRHKKYPAAARAKRFSGTVTVNFTVNASGNVVASRMVKGSGHSALDQEAMALVKRASPFKAIPHTINRNTMTLTVPIHFTTR